ncbi:MAG: PKD domain-containing protein [Cytophagales bacterium]|nr:PKD domain-containing protein [Cytophagales bacterium]
MKTSAKYSFLLLMFLLSWTGYGQDSEQFFKDKKKVNSLKNTIGPSKCVTIDVSAALDTNNQPYSYVWDLGDGSKKTGTKIRHCYPENGKYTASLTLADSALEVYMENEIVLDVNLSKDTILVDGSDSISVGHELKLLPKFSSGKHYNVESYFWDFGNGQYSNSTIGKISYSETGNYTIRLGAIIKKKKKTYTVICSKNVTVFHIITPKALIDAFNEKRQNEDKISRYLREDVHLTLFNSIDSSSQVIESLEKFGYRVTLEKDKSYEVYAHRGNIFSEVIHFSTFNTKDDFEVQHQFKLAIGEMVNKGLQRVPPIYFNKSKATANDNKRRRSDAKRERSFTKESKDTLKNVAILLQEYPSLKVCIGVHTHTGQSSQLRFKRVLFKDRALKIQEFLIKKGVNPKQITFVTHNDDETLINSCDGCSRENAALNRRAEFKIIYIKEQ